MDTLGSAAKRKRTDSVTDSQVSGEKPKQVKLMSRLAEASPKEKEDMIRAELMELLRPQFGALTSEVITAMLQQDETHIIQAIQGGHTMALKFAMELGQTGNGEFRKRIILAARATVNQEVDKMSRELQDALTNHQSAIQMSEQRAVVARALWAEYNKQRTELASDKAQLEVAHRMVNALR